MNLIRRARVSLVAALLGCTCAAMLALGPGGGKNDGKTAGATGGGTMLYVDDDAPAGGDGLTWPTAHRFLQDALDAAREPKSGVTEIRVAGGEYKPDQGASVTPGDSFATFWIPAGLTVAGGYAGLPEPDPDVRDWSLYVTTFNGDLLGNDGPLGGFENNGENSIHISRIEQGTTPAHLSGIRFIRSRASFSPENIGGAVRCENASVMIADCRFEGNRAAAGGALGVINGQSIIARSVFDLNRSPFGGAIRTLHSVVTIDYCELTRNEVTGSGGAVSCFGGSMLLASCDLRMNSANTDGGAIYAFQTSTVHMHGCSFENNHSSDYGGAINAPVIAEHCEFIGNTAVSVGAADGNGGPFVFKDCRFANNFASYECGAVRSAGGTFINCVFEDNVAFVLQGGAVLGAGTFVNCEFLDNRAKTTGGAIHLTFDSKFVNTTFVANQSGGQGGAIFAAPGVQVDVTNCTLLANTGAGDGSAVTGPADITNSIVWGHGDAPFDSIGDVTFSCVQSGWPGEGNLDADPSFINAPGLDGVLGNGDDDLRLSAGSPCIDSANNAAIPADTVDVDDDGDTTELTPLDLSGGVRRVNDPATIDGGNAMGLQTVVDMGALEFRDFKMRVGDTNSDGVVNIDDLLEVIGAWGTCPIAPVPCPQDIAPSGGNGEIDVSDLLLVIDNWFFN